MQSGYCELHLHDYYSTLDGLNSPDEYFERAAELGMTHLPETNHGTLVGHRPFQKAAKKAGIIPILGVEAYISATDRFDRRSNAKRSDGTSVYNHIILLAQGEEGLNTLHTLNENAWRDGFYHKPRIDMDLLEEHNSGLIVLSGCLNGLIAKAIAQDDWDKATAIAARLKSMLGDRFFIEVQDHNPFDINAGLFKIADTMGIPPVVTSDCHYARKEDLWKEEAMLILSTNPKRNNKAEMSKAQKMDLLERFNYLYPDRTMTFQEIEIYLRSREEHLEAFAAQGWDRTDIVDNTMEIASRIGEYPFHEALDLLPRPKKGHPDEILVRKAFEGLRKLGLGKKQEYIDRLEEELKIIKDKKFSTYFLIVSNMINWARGQGILVGPGRGSSAGSLLCYCLGITQVDPIEHGLLFFRFLDVDRNDWPDIDVDFQKSRRGEVKNYLRRQFKHVAEIMTVNEFQGKSAVKAAGRVFGVPVAEVNKATKSVDTPPDKPDLFWPAFEKSEKGSAFRKKYPEVMELARVFSGRISNIGKHPAGIVMGSEPLQNYFPIETAKDPQDKDGARVPVVAMDMKDADEAGLIKIDALGLKTLDVLADVLEAVYGRHGRYIELTAIPLNDKKVFDMLSKGYTRGVFQAEGGTFTKWLLETGATEFNDLVIGTSIARPGPLTTVGEIYKRRLAGKEAVSYPHEVMEKVLNETLGVIVYQEQVMLAMTELAGMKMSTANKVRKIIGKKLDKKEFLPYMEEFVNGASQKVSKQVAEKLWHDFEAHAGYSFNKSHAVVYSLLTYWTAWFKANYPTEFIYAILKNEKDGTDAKDKITEYLIEAKRLGVRVLLPHVNKSGKEFTMEGDAIRFGLVNIKFVADKTADNLMAYRPYRDYAHLEAKVKEKGSGLNSRCLQGLNAVGAAAFPDNPKTGEERDNLYEYLSVPAFAAKELPPRITAQIRPLDEFEEKGCFIVMGMVRKVVRKDHWARVEILDETGTAGIFHNYHTPIEEGQMYAILVGDNRVARFVKLADIHSKSDNLLVQHMAATNYPDLTDGFYKVIAFESTKTKAGKKMAYMVFSDAEKNLIRVMAFPNDYIKAYSKCVEGAVIYPQLKQTEEGAYFIESVE